MRVPVSWLRDYVSVEMPLEELATRLSISTAEVEGIERRGVSDEDGNLGLFRVGKVLEADKHPNADRLQLCKVDVGEGEPRQIVCGAWNFGPGATVAVALPGAMLPGGLQLEQRKVRGELSDGMILAEDEIDLGTDHSGIMVLPETEPGTPLGDVLPLVEEVLLLESTGNRPDLLSIYGIAREVAALYELELGPPPGVDPEPAGDEPVDVTVDDLEGCPRYIGRLFRNVAMGQSPVWLKSRLLAAGMRPISNIVDATNYVMLALGNPLHAFDLKTLAGGKIVVRRAKPGEVIQTLDGVERKLEETDLVIADAERAVAIAGIMGGEETEIGESTTEVLLEAANFEPTGIYRTSERLRLRTEGSNRWEKGVDPYLADQAAKLATQLIVETAGAEWVGHVDVQGELPARPVITYRPERADEVVGIETPAGRADSLARAARLREPRRRGRRANLPRPGRDARDRRRRGDRAAAPRGRSLHAPDAAGDVRRPDADPAAASPRREHAGRPRARRDVHALAAARRSRSEGVEARRADLDRVRHPPHAAPAQPRRRGSPERRARLGGHRPLRGGPRLPCRTATCRTSTRTSPGSSEGGWQRAKGVVEALYAALKAEPGFERTSDDLLHPGKAASVGAGIVGELHPAALEGVWGVFELDLAGLQEAANDDVRYADVITYPAVRQDLAFSVPEEVPAGDLVAAAHEAAGPELREMTAFDVYRGGQVGEGRKSIAFAVSFQSSERTLSDEDAATLREKIVDALAKQFGAELRRRP